MRDQIERVIRRIAETEDGEEFREMLKASGNFDDWYLFRALLAAAQRKGRAVLEYFEATLSGVEDPDTRTFAETLMLDTLNSISKMNSEFASPLFADGRHDRAFARWLHLVCPEEPAAGELFMHSVIQKVTTMKRSEEDEVTSKMLEVIENGIRILEKVRERLLPIETVRVEFPDAIERWPLVFAVANVAKVEASK